MNVDLKSALNPESRFRSFRLRNRQGKVPLRVEIVGLNSRQNITVLERGYGVLALFIERKKSLSINSRGAILQAEADQTQALNEALIFFIDLSADIQRFLFCRHHAKENSAFPIEA